MLKICFHSTVDAFYGLLKKKRKKAEFYCGMFVASKFEQKKNMISSLFPS